MERTYNQIWERKIETETPHKQKKNCKCRNCQASRLLGKGVRLLDVGCGNGSLSTLVVEKYDEFYGVDISPIALAKAAEKGVKTTCLNIDNEQLPFGDAFFDAVTCLDVLEHVLNPVSLVVEMNRVLKIDGIIVIATPNMRYWRHIVSLAVFGRFPRTSGDTEAYDGGHIHYFTRKDLESLLIMHGFRVLHSSFLHKNVFSDLGAAGITIKAKKERHLGDPKSGFI